MLNNVLIVDDESSLLFSIEAGFAAFQNKIKIFTAEHGKAAVQILESKAIDLVVTDIKMPQMDGFELLAHMSSRFPEIPVVVMSAYATPDIEAQFKAMGTLRILEKPVDFNELVHTVQEGLSYSAQQGSISGISVDSFLQLVEMEEKTCLLEVRNQEGQKGLFSFYQGRLYDAVCGDLRGQAAAVEIAMWDNVRLNLKNLAGKKIKQRITTGLMSILMEASRRKDETREECGIDSTAVTGRQNSSLEPVFHREQSLVEKGAEPSIEVENDREHGKLEDLLRKAADKMAAIQIIVMADMDGRCLAGHSATGMDKTLFSTKMAGIMDMLVVPAREISGCDRVLEAIVRTDKGWIVCCCMAPDIWLGTMIDGDCTPEQIQQLLDETAGKLAGPPI
ncbi:MAG: hypothetical protein B6I22_03330 [Desulfobacteraceae bacterium 4572_123]|nr:MAG: hypothetical protein B6I22_03330 [Desulfobacteraceae bacterium 4572_123]